jgi:NTP pyrophosphatase (non-canonical NTP hydrolase)
VCPNLEDPAVAQRGLGFLIAPAANVASPRFTGMELSDLQRLMAATYGEQDRGRGLPATVAWLTEELGELAQAVRKGTPEEQLHELGDVLAWLASLADQLGLSLDDAAARYADGCPKCGGIPCTCTSAV